MFRGLFVLMLTCLLLAAVCGGCDGDLFKGRFICDNGQTVGLELRGDPATIEKLSGVQVRSPFAGDEASRITCDLVLDEHHDRPEGPFPLGGR